VWGCLPLGQKLKDLGGAISINSEKDIGTKFTIKLPLLK